MMETFIVILITAVFHIAQARFPFPRTEPVTYEPLGDSGEALILTPLIEANQIQEARNVSEVHLDDFLNVTSYSGYFKVDKENNGILFFWFFPSVNNYAEDPVILWLQGGPGMSGLVGVFAEHGPFIYENNSMSLREFSWHKNYSMLYIDQPVITGWSTTNGNPVTSIDQVREHLYSALIQFFTMFSELQGNAFFVAGESYGGKYVPAIGYTIHEQNPTAAVKINLQGLMIGNGLSDPVHQLNYGDLLYQLGLIDLPLLEAFYVLQNYTVAIIELEKYVLASGAWHEMIELLFYRRTSLGNIYNYMKDTDDIPSAWRYFINVDDVREALHVGREIFNYESYQVYAGLYNDIPQSVAPWIAELLDNYRVLIYNGQLDIMVGYASTSNYLQYLNFRSAPEYKSAERYKWTVGERVAGYVKTAGNLTEVLVRDAGHMVPMDQPEFAFDLISKFIANVPIAENNTYN